MSSGAPELVRRVVVIGGSLSGLLAAAALSGGGREVTVVERDAFPAAPRPRDGVPQSRQTHVFLYRGLQAAEELLPGLRDELLAAGAVPFNGGDLLWLSADGWLPRTDGFEVLSATRPLIEHVVRGRVLALPGVRAEQGRRVSGLARGVASTGAAWEVALQDGTVLGADLVVDASGRSTRLPGWLAELGVEVPETETLDAHVGYATRLYRSRGDLPDFPGVVVAATADSLTGALALRAEGDHWLISAIGFGDRRPPRDGTAFEAFLSGLVDPAVADIAARCEPVGDVHVHRQTANQRHPYERVRDWPDGLVAVGDALCAFDPVYGQGVTVGALQALELRRAARTGLRRQDSGRVQRRLVATAAPAWAMATGADRSFPTSEQQPTRLQALLGRWTGVLAKLAVHGDPRATSAMSRVYNLTAPPQLLLHPALAGSAARAALLGWGPVTERPAVLADLARPEPAVLDELAARRVS